MEKTLFLNTTVIKYIDTKKNKIKITLFIKHHYPSMVRREQPSMCIVQNFNYYYCSSIKVTLLKALSSTLPKRQKKTTPRNDDSDTCYY